MTDSELYALIQSDPAAVAAYSVSDDDACAARCSVIAPTVRRPVPAEEVQAAQEVQAIEGQLKQFQDDKKQQ